MRFASNIRMSDVTATVCVGRLKGTQPAHTAAQDFCGPLCCLTRLCNMATSVDHELHLHHILRHFSSTDFSELKLKVHENSISTAVDPLTLMYFGTPVPDSSISVYLCSYTSWLRVRTIVQLMSDKMFLVFGYARLCSSAGQSSTSFMWRLEVCCLSSIDELEEGRGFVWYWIPHVFNGLFQWIVSEKMGLHIGRTSCREMYGQDDGQTKQHSVRTINILHEMEDDALFLSSISVRTVWSTENIQKYVTTAFTHGAAVCITSWNPCDALQQEHSSASRIIPKNCGAFEVEDIDLSIIKTEVKAVLKINKTPKKLVLCEEENIDELRTLFFKFAAFAKKRKFYIMAQDTMLIVRCPGCFAEFKGSSNRMLRLIDHVISQHPTSIESYFKKIKIRYKTIIETAKRQLSTFTNKPEIHKIMCSRTPDKVT